MLKVLSFFMMLSSGFVCCMDVKRVTITTLPVIIRGSGVYTLSADIVDSQDGKKHKPFASAIRIFNNANVVINLNGHTLDAGGRTFGIDANGANRLMIYNGAIEGAQRALSSLNNDVTLCMVHTDQCTYPIETTPTRTKISDINGAVQ